MAIETELKLRIAPEQLARLKRHALIKSLSVTRPVTRRLQNIYYDTPKLDLHRSRMALRLRHASGKWVQTLKGGGSMQAGLHQRNEWEVPVHGAELDFSATQSVEWDEHLRPSLRKKLHPVFVTDFTRNSRMLDFRGAQIELCMDHGEVRTEQQSMPICELELELKSGDPQQLFELALELLNVVPFELETVSKAEKGYHLLSGYSGQPLRGTTPLFARTDTLADLLKTLIWSCLQHFQGNLSGAMGSDDDEYLHQMRVALRRLRVALRMTEEIRADEQLAGLYKDVSDICIALGIIREWDVFIAGTVQPMCARMAGHAGLQALLTASERQRAAGYASLRSAAQAREMQRLLLRFAIWMNGAYWQQPDTGQSARDFATRRLHKLAKRFEQSGRHQDTFDAPSLHALRILAKKIRYSAEFFASLYGKKKASTFLAALSEVQEVLGQINDVAAAHRLLDGLTKDAVLADHPDAVTLCRGWTAHDLSRQLGVLRKSMRHLSKQAAFWEK